jgi:hypothetical protein
MMVALSACTATPASPAPPAAAAPSWEPITAQAGATTTEAPARVLPSADALTVVTAPFRARVTAVKVRAGDEVLANAPLLEVVMPEVLDAAARFDGASGRLQAATDRLTQLTRLKDEGLARAMEVTEAASRVADAKADRQLALATLRAANVRELDVPALLASGVQTLRATRAGVVLDVAATPGSAYEPTSGPLVRLGSTGPGRVEARFARPVEDGDWELKVGEHRWPLTRRSVAPGADPKDGTFVAWFDGVDLPRADTLGRVTRSSSASAAGAFRVPAQAISKVEGHAVVHTHSGAVAVEVRSCTGNECVVTGALTASDQVQVTR